MTPHLEQRLMEIAAREGYEPASEYVHAMRLAVAAAFEWLPMESCPNGVNILISRDDGTVEFVSAEYNYFTWQPYKGPRERGISKPNGWMPSPQPKPLRNKKGAER